MATEEARPRYLQPEEPSVGHLVTVADVASMTGLSDTAVYRAIAAGELRATKLRGRLRIRLTDIDVWIEANAVQPSPTEPERVISRPRGAGLASVAPAPVPRRGRGLRELLHAQA